MPSATGGWPWACPRSSGSGFPQGRRRRRREQGSSARQLTDGGTWRNPPKRGFIHLHDRRSTFARHVPAVTKSAADRPNPDAAAWGSWPPSDDLLGLLVGRHRWIASRVTPRAWIRQMTRVFTRLLLDLVDEAVVAPGRRRQRREIVGPIPATKPVLDVDRCPRFDEGPPQSAAQCVQPHSPPRSLRRLATKAAAWALRSRFNFDRMELT